MAFVTLSYPACTLRHKASTLEGSIPMTTNQKSALALIAALLIGAVAQHYVNAEATALGLTTLEIAAAGLVAGSVVKRALG